MEHPSPTRPAIQSCRQGSHSRSQQFVGNPANARREPCETSQEDAQAAHARPPLVPPDVLTPHRVNVNVHVNTDNLSRLRVELPRLGLQRVLEHAGTPRTSPLIDVSLPGCTHACNTGQTAPPSWRDQRTLHAFRDAVSAQLPCQWRQRPHAQSCGQPHRPTPLNRRSLALTGCIAIHSTTALWTASGATPERAPVASPAVSSPRHNRSCARPLLHHAPLGRAPASTRVAAVHQDSNSTHRSTYHSTHHSTQHNRKDRTHRS